MGAKENFLSDQLMMAFSDTGDRLFRNNSGVAWHKDGSVVRYGVGSPGGSDLIGFKRVLITPAMVGSRLAVFTAVEVKTGKLKPTSDQDKFLEMVRAKNGLGVWGTELQAILRDIDQAL